MTVSSSVTDKICRFVIANELQKKLREHLQKLELVLKDCGYVSMDDLVQVFQLCDKNHLGQYFHHKHENHTGICNSCVNCEISFEFEESMTERTLNIAKRVKWPGIQPIDSKKHEFKLYGVFLKRAINRQVMRYIPYMNEK